MEERIVLLIGQEEAIRGVTNERREGRWMKAV